METLEKDLARQAVLGEALTDLAVVAQGGDRRRPDDTVVVPIVGEIGIGECTAGNIIQRIGDATKLKFLITSPGGSCLETFAIIRSLGSRHFDCEIRGHCSSGAVLLTLAADTVRIEQSATMMVHTGRAWLNGTADEFARAAESIREIEAHCSAMLKTKVAIPSFVDEWNDGKDHRFTAAEAVALGLADEIFTESAPAWSGPQACTATDESRVLAILDSLGTITVSDRWKFANTIARKIFYHSVEI